MLDIKTIREREADVRAMLQFKRSDVNLDAILALDKERRGLLTEVEALKNQRNVESKKLGEIKRAGGDISAQQLTMRELGAPMSTRSFPTAATE